MVSGEPFRLCLRFGVRCWKRFGSGMCLWVFCLAVECIGVTQGVGVGVGQCLFFLLFFFFLKKDALAHPCKPSEAGPQVGIHRHLYFCSDTAKVWGRWAFF